MIYKTSTKRRRRRRARTAPDVRLHNSQPAAVAPRQYGSRPVRYASETMRPIVCLAFVLPLLLFYEFGSIFTGQAEAKSGVDRWLHQLLESIGIGHLVILPILTAAALLFLHHRSADRWNFRPQVLLGMFAESCCLGMILYLAGNAVHEIMSVSSSPGTLSIGDSGQQNWWSCTVAFIGCGVYEELIFRLLMLNGIIWMGKRHFGTSTSKISGTLITSLIFSLLHYDLINPGGSEFEMFSFIFRFSASLLFCFLFLVRGFGIAVGTHCTYDVLTQI